MPKIGKGKMKYETPRAEDIKSKDGEETVSIDFKSDKQSETANELPKNVDNSPKKKESKKCEEKAGYCDCCSLRYKDLKKHLKSDHHRRFALDPTNFKELDSLINRGNNFQKFLDDLKVVTRLQKLNTRNISTATTTSSSVVTITAITTETHCVECNVLNDHFVEEKNGLPVPIFKSPVRLSSSKMMSPRRSPRIHCQPENKEFDIITSQKNFIPINHNQCLDHKQNISPSPICTPQATDEKHFSFPVVTCYDNTPLTSSPVHINQQTIFAVASTPMVTTFQQHSSPTKNHLSANKENDTRTNSDFEKFKDETSTNFMKGNEFLKTNMISNEPELNPNHEDRELRRKVKRKSRKSSRRSSQSQTTQEDCNENDEFTKIFVVEELVGGLNSEKRKEIAIKDFNVETDDPEITFNANCFPSFELPISPHGKKRAEEFHPNDTLVDDAVKNKTLNDIIELDVSLDSTCELTKRPDDENLNGGEKEIKSFIEENFSDESLKENFQPDFLGFKEDGQDALSDIISNEHQSNNKNLNIMFSDEDDDDENTFDENFSLENIMKVEEFDSFDNISVAILKNGSTPKGNRVTRSRLTSNDFAEGLSPPVTKSSIRTLRRKKSELESDDTMLKSPSLKRSLNLRSQTPRKASICAQETPKKTRKDSRKRSATTPDSGRCRKRSRTTSNVSTASTSIKERQQKTRSISETSSQKTIKFWRKHNESKVSEYNCTMIDDDVFEEEIEIGKINNKLIEKTAHDHELAQILSSSLCDRLKNYSRKAKSTSGSQSSSSSNSPRKHTIFEKVSNTAVNAPFNTKLLDQKRTSPRKKTPMPTLVPKSECREKIIQIQNPTKLKAVLLPKTISPKKKKVTPTLIRKPIKTKLIKNVTKKTRVNSKLKSDSPFGDPKILGKTKDKNTAALLDDFDAMDSENNTSHNSSLNSSYLSYKRSTNDNKNVNDNDNDFNDFIPTKHRRPKMSR